MHSCHGSIELCSIRAASFGLEKCPNTTNPTVFLICICMDHPTNLVGETSFLFISTLKHLFCQNRILLLGDLCFTIVKDGKNFEYPSLGWFRWMFFSIASSLSDSTWMDSSSFCVWRFHKTGRQPEPAEATYQILPHPHPSSRHPNPKGICLNGIFVSSPNQPC